MGFGTEILKNDSETESGRESERKRGRFRTCVYMCEESPAPWPLTRVFKLCVRERAHARDREKSREREREYVCVCVCAKAVLLNGRWPDFLDGERERQRNRERERESIFVYFYVRRHSSLRAIGPTFWMARERKRERERESTCGREEIRQRE